jgi:hypothetical protein
MLTPKSHPLVPGIHALGSTKKWLAPITGGVYGVGYQVLLKIVSKSPFFREADKDRKNDSNGRTPT